jgi:RES domain-containing protein
MRGELEVQDFGDRFVHEGRAALLFVPSVLVPEETNVLLNPAHPEFVRMVWRQPLVPFSYHGRLL